MRFVQKGRISEFIQEFSGDTYRDEDDIPYSDLKKLWIKHQHNQTKYKHMFDLLVGCEVRWENFYPQRKTKTPEEMAAYKARLLDLEYKQLTKGMEHKPRDYFQVRH